MRLLICMTLHCPWSQRTAITLRRLGHEVHVVDFDRVDESGLVNPAIRGIADDFAAFAGQVDGVHRLRTLGRGKVRYVLGAAELSWLARRLRVDALVTFYGGGFALMAYLSGIRPYYVYVVGSDVLKVSPMNARVNALTLGAATRVFANGEFLSYRAQLQAPAAAVERLLIGIDPDEVPLAAPPESPVCFINTRGFQPVYNQETIVRAIARLPASTRPFRFIFTSGGSDLPRIQAVADEILAPERRRNVEFWGGVARERLLGGLGQAHAFVSMSLSDGTSTSLLEALAAGLHPIVSDIPQNREWVRPGGPGRLVSPLDVEGLASALAELVEHPELARATAPLRARVLDTASAVVNQRRLSAALERPGAA